jgi:hypothetical protein
MEELIMTTTKDFVPLILEFLGENVIEYQVHGYHYISVNLRDVNFTIDGISWEKVMSKFMKENGYIVAFGYDNGNWADIFL